jgi:uncharacterized protein YcaQ
VNISLETVRRLALYVQGLDGHWALPGGKEGAAQVIERLGYVQVDTISVIQRAHHHIIWTRFPDYHPSMLHELHSQDRRVFEWWTHAASYIPMHHYRYYATVMAEDKIRPWRQKWLDENADLIDHVFAHVRREGAVAGADFETPADSSQQTGWWGWKPAKQALEALFDMGKLMVSERRQFQRIYDLPERVLPTYVDTRPVDEEAMAHFVIRRALGMLGIGRLGDLTWWRRRAKRESLTALISSGEVTPVTVEGFEDEKHYVLTAPLEAVLSLSSSSPQLHLLSPFDNLVTRRREVDRYFGFDYKLEAYFPAAKREYGYFALPILFGTDFIGRVDTKADRKSKTLIVCRLTFEPHFTDYGGVMPILARKLHAFAIFNECEAVMVEEVVPAHEKLSLVKALADV